MRVAGCLLHPMDCPLLRETPDNLTSVADAVNLATILDTSKICVGNCDDKFKRVTKLHKIFFKDRAGN